MGTLILAVLCDKYFSPLEIYSSGFFVLIVSHKGAFVV